MANINLVEKPETINLDYYRNGIFQNTTVDSCLDPNGTPILFTFNSEVISAGSAPQFEWIPYTNGNTALPINVIVDSTFTIFGEVFTVVANPGQNQIPTGTTIAERNELVVQLAEQINANNNLNWRFIAQVNEFTVFAVLYKSLMVRAKNKGTIYNFIAPTNINFVVSNISRNTTFFSINPGTDENRGELLQNYNYSVFVELWKVTDPFEWGQLLGFNNIKADLIADLAISWTSSNRFTFDISKYLTPYTTVPLPSVNLNSLFFPVQTSIASYFLKYGEQFNGGFNSTTQLPIDSSDNITNTYIRKNYIDTTDIRWTSPGVLDLAVNPPVFNDKWSVTSGNVSAYNTIKILSNQPKFKLRRRVYDSEFVYVYSYNDQNGGPPRTFQLSHEYFFIDGTSVFRTTHGTLNDYSGMYLIDLRLNNIKFDNTETNNSNRIIEIQTTIQISRNGGANYDPLSEVTYSIDLNYEPDNYLKLYWRNPYGVFDQFEFEGLQIKEIDVNPINYSKTLSTRQGYRRNEINKGVFKNQIQKVFTINTGWINQEHYLWLQELLETTEVYRIVDFVQNGVTTKKFEAMNIIDYSYLLNENETQYNMEIKLISSTEENSIIS